MSNVYYHASFTMLLIVIIFIYTGGRRVWREFVTRDAHKERSILKLYTLWSYVFFLSFLTHHMFHSLVLSVHKSKRVSLLMPSGHSSIFILSEPLPSFSSHLSLYSLICTTWAKEKYYDYTTIKQEIIVQMRICRRDRKANSKSKLN